MGGNVHKYSFKTEGESTAILIVDNDTDQVVEKIDEGTHFRSWVAARKRRTNLEAALANPTPLTAPRQSQLTP